MLAQKISATFAAYQPGYRSDADREGKSGQQRATYRLSAGFPFTGKRKGHRKLPLPSRYDPVYPVYNRKGVRMKT